MGLAVTKQEAFWEACGFGSRERVQKYIEDGIDVNWVSCTHNSCAIHVASQGKAEIVQMLLDAGCNVNARDDRGNLALHHAAMRGHSDIAQMLIDAGSEINAQDKNGWTALITAAYFCQEDVVKVLINNKCSVNLQNKDMRTALHETCRSPSDDEHQLHDITKVLIESGADINSKSSDLGGADFTPLIFSAYHGHALVAQALIDACCDVNAQESNSWTALHWACDRNQSDVVHVLINANIDIHIPGRRGELAISRTQNVEILHMLTDDNTCKAKQSTSGFRTGDEQLTNINSCISCTAVEHVALVEELELDSLSDNDCSVSDSDEYNDSKEQSCVPETADEEGSKTDSPEPAGSVTDQLI